MKKYNFIMAIFAGFAMLSCNEDLLNYDDTKASIYFNSLESKITRSFVVTPDNSIEVDIPVKIVGSATGNDRSFSLRVLQDSTTAELGTHYEALQDSYVVPAGEFETTIKVVVKRPADDETENRKLGLVFDYSGAFTPGPTNGQFISISFGNTLQEPESWPYQYGYYDIEKLRLFFIVNVREEFKFDFPSAGYFDFRSDIYDSQTNYYLTNIVRTAMIQYVKDNAPVYDSQGNVMDQNSFF